MQTSNAPCLMGSKLNQKSVDSTQNSVDSHKIFDDCNRISYYSALPDPLFGQDHRAIIENLIGSTQNSVDFSPECTQNFTPARMADFRTLGIYTKFSANVVNQKITKLDFQDKLWSQKEISAGIVSQLEKYTTYYRNVRYMDKDGTEQVTKQRKYVPARICECGKTPMTKKSEDKSGNRISYIAGQSGNRYFAGLFHCGMYWICPVCGYKIETVRVDEIYSTLNEYVSRGYEVYFLTLTLPHYRSEKLSDNLNLLIEGYDKVRTQRTVKSKITGRCQAMDKDGVLHETNDFFSLRSLEITYGKNGFHPHLHCVYLFPKSGGYAVPYLEEFKKEWLQELTRNNKGNRFIQERAVTYYSWDGRLKTLSEYVSKWATEQHKTENEASDRLIRESKWNIAHEVAKGQSKKSKGGYSPFEILEVIRNGGKWELPADPSAVFREYATAIKGRSMIQGCRYFYTNVGIRIKTDDEILQDDKQQEILFSVDRDLWSQVVKKKLVAGLRRIYEIGEIYDRGCESIELFFQDNGIEYIRDDNFFRWRMTKEKYWENTS